MGPIRSASKAGEPKRTEEVTHVNVDANLRDSRRTLQGEHIKIDKEDGESATGP